MEIIKWRYQPEFKIVMTIDGMSSGSGIRCVPTANSHRNMQNYGLVAYSSDGAVMCSARQRYNGVDFVPAVALTTPTVFAFAIEINPGLPALDFFEQGKTSFGRRILYANNLSGAGVIDDNVIANAVRLTPGADVALADAGSASGGIPSAEFNPGTFNVMRAGKIRAGATVNYTFNQTIDPSTARASIDLSIQEAGGYVLLLDGGTPMQENVIIDPAIAGSNVQGIIEIFRDSWLLPAQPRNYHLNLTSV